MNRPKNVSVSVVAVGGELRVWGASFTVKGSLPLKDGQHDTARAKRIAKHLEAVLAAVDVGEIP